MYSVVPIRIVLVHKKCCRDFTDQNRGVGRNAEETEVPCAKRLRSGFFQFNWKEHCMLCGKHATFDARHPNRTQVKLYQHFPYVARFWR